MINAGLMRTALRTCQSNVPSEISKVRMKPVTKSLLLSDFHRKVFGIVINNIIDQRNSDSKGGSQNRKILPDQ